MPPLAAIPLSSTFARFDPSDQAVMLLALAFLEQTSGSDSVERLIPALGTSANLGKAIRTTLDIDPQTLESAWQNYLRNAAQHLQDGEYAKRYPMV